MAYQDRILLYKSRYYQVNLINLKTIFLNMMFEESANTLTLSYENILIITQSTTFSELFDNVEQKFIDMLQYVDCEVNHNLDIGEYLTFYEILAEKFNNKKLGFWANSQIRQSKERCLCGNNFSYDKYCVECLKLNSPERK